VAEEAEAVIAAMGEKAVPPLVEMIDGGSQGSHARLISLIGSTHSDAALQYLIQYLCTYKQLFLRPDGHGYAEDPIYSSLYWAISSYKEAGIDALENILGGKKKGVNLTDSQLMAVVNCLAKIGGNRAIALITEIRNAVPASMINNTKLVSVANDALRQLKKGA
jgi:hypothetical protein